jgi:hypothetical protein
MRSRGASFEPFCNRIDPDLLVLTEFQLKPFTLYRKVQFLGSRKTLKRCSSAVCLAWIGSFWCAPPPRLGFQFLPDTTLRVRAAPWHSANCDAMVTVHWSLFSWYDAEVAAFIFSWMQEERNSRPLYYEYKGFPALCLFMPLFFFFWWIQNVVRCVWFLFLPIIIFSVLIL